MEVLEFLCNQVLQKKKYVDGKIGVFLKEHEDLNHSSRNKKRTCHKDFGQCGKLNCPWTNLTSDQCNGVPPKRNHTVIVVYY